MSDPEKAVGDDDLEVDDEDAKKNATIDFEQMMRDLPPEVKRRVKALKKIQLSVTEVETKFYEEMHALEVKYLPLYQQFFDKRRQITTGEYEPNDEECEFVDGHEEELTEQMDQLKIQKEGEGDGAEKVSGIPGFWLTIMNNVELLSELVEDCDAPILQHLTDITVDMMSEPMGFRLNFHFSSNEFFSNGVLTKTYEMKCEVDPEDPFNFEGPEIVKCKGCTIDWHKGKNVTTKVVKKKQRHKQRETIRTVVKTVPVPSFFSFFSPPQVDDIKPEDVDEETQIQLTNDFEVGQYIRERIIPRAVLYFTGEALEEEFDDEDEEEEDDDDDDDEDDEDGEAPGSGARPRKKKAPGSANKNQECKTQ